MSPQIPTRRLLLAGAFAAVLVALAVSAQGFEPTCTSMGDTITCSEFCTAPCVALPACPCWPAGLSGIPYLCYDNAGSVLNHFAVVSPLNGGPAFYQISALGCRGSQGFIPTSQMSAAQIQACDEDLFDFCGVPDPGNTCEDICACGNPG